MYTLDTGYYYRVCEVMSCDVPQGSNTKMATVCMLTFLSGISNGETHHTDVEGVEQVKG